MEKRRFGDFIVHFNTNSMIITFGVFPVLDWAKISDGSTGTSYIVKDTGCETLDVFDEEKAEKQFDGSYCWRGFWEGRLYFKQYEYWGEELKEMYNIYENNIVPWCKAFIKKREPHGYYDE